MSTYSASASPTRRRRYLILGTALAITAAGLVAIMNRNQAGAATVGEVAVHCRDGSPLLDDCTFIQRSETAKDGDSFRVSEPQNNCDGTVADSFSLSISVRSLAEVRIDTREFSGLNGTLSFPGVFDGTVSTLSERMKITGFREDTAATVTINGEVQPGERAAIYFRPEVVEVGGFLQATYRAAEADGTRVFFFPEQNADTALVRFPLANDNGDPKGFYWIRSIRCVSGTSNGPASVDDVSPQNIPDFDDSGFGELANVGVADTPVAPG